MHLSQRTLLVSFTEELSSLFFFLLEVDVVCWNRAMSSTLIYPRFKALLSSAAHVHTELLTRKPAPTTTAAHFPTAAHSEEAGLGAGRGQMQELNKRKCFTENRKWFLGCTSNFLLPQSKSLKDYRWYMCGIFSLFVCRCHDHLVHTKYCGFAVTFFFSVVLLLHCL